MTRWLIALATTVALVGPAAAGPKMPTFAVNDWCAGPLDQTQVYHWPNINSKDWPFLITYDRHEAVGDKSCGDALVVTANRFTFMPDGIDDDITCARSSFASLSFTAIAETEVLPGVCGSSRRGATPRSRSTCSSTTRALS
jgi:hypothetical protein